MAKDKQAYRYQITINNPKDKGYTKDTICQKLVTMKTLTYFCMALEIGNETKQEHYHVFICFSSRVRWSSIKRKFPEAHIEACKATIADNISYVRKDGKWENSAKSDTTVEGTFYEFGEVPSDSKGTNDDLKELYHMINAGMSNAQIIAENQDYIMQIDKLDKIRTIILQEKFKNTRRLDLEVTYIYGETGSGKTRGVLDKFGDGNVYRVTDYLHPFDGYSCQDIILFDEFRSSLKLQDMLLYLDIYPLELPSRYSNKFACYTKVFVLSNWSLEKQFSDIRQNDQESWNAFLRRIHKVECYESRYKKKVYSSVQDYLKRQNSEIVYSEECSEATELSDLGFGEITVSEVKFYE